MNILPFDAVGARRHERRGPPLGWGVSVVLHALALFSIWHAKLSPPTEAETNPRRTIEVQLMPAATQAPRNPPAPPVAPRPTPRTSRRLATSPVSGAAIASDKPSLPEVRSMPEAAPSSDNASVSEAIASGFDMEAARASARQLAREDNKGRKEKLTAHFDTQIQEKLEHARRADCRNINAQSMNLLGSAFVIAKNIAKNVIDESGCKW